MSAAEQRRTSALGPPLRSDDALVRMLHVQDRIVWHGVEATDRSAPGAGIHLLVPVSTGLLVLHGPSGRVLDLPFGRFRRLRARPLNGSVEMEVQTDDERWRTIVWSTRRREASRFVEAMAELERRYG